MERMLKYIDFYQHPTNIPQSVFEVEFRNDLIACGLFDLQWNNIFEKYRIQPMKNRTVVSDIEIAHANSELLGALLTYIVIDSQNSSVSNIYDHGSFLIKVLTRLAILISDSDTNAIKGETDAGVNSV